MAMSSSRNWESRVFWLRRCAGPVPVLSRGANAAVTQELPTRHVFPEVVQQLRGVGSRRRPSEREGSGGEDSRAAELVVRHLRLVRGTVSVPQLAITRVPRG